MTEKLRDEDPCRAGCIDDAIAYARCGVTVDTTGFEGYMTM